MIKEDEPILHDTARKGNPKFQSWEIKPGIKIDSVLNDISKNTNASFNLEESELIFISKTRTKISGSVQCDT